MVSNTNTKIRLIVYAVFLFSGNLFAQNPITRFDLVGDLETKIAPGEIRTFRVIAEAEGQGTLTVRIREQSRPAFVDNLDERLEIHGSGQLKTTFQIAPSQTDCGSHKFELVAIFKSAADTFRRNKTVRFGVAPKIAPEPPFSPGIFNSLCWTPCDSAHQHVLRHFPDGNATKSPTTLNNLNASTCDSIGNLTGGVRYGYFVEVNVEREGGFQTFNSDIVYSTQDNLPPPEIVMDGFTVDAQGHVTLRWAKQPDQIGFIDHYLITRTEVATGAESEFTLPFFPISQIAPKNFVPIAVKKKDPLYVDSLAIINKIPKAIRGSAMIQTAWRDRWNESADYLSFKLETESHVYIAFDNKISPKPDWLNALGFESFNPENLKSKDLQTSVGSFRLFTRNAAFKADEIIRLGGNLASGAELKTLDPKMFVVFVQPVSKNLPYALKDFVEYTDALGVENDLKTFRYRVAAVDAAGNRSDWAESPPVILDLHGKCKPIITKWYDAVSRSGDYFAEGVNNTVYIQDPSTQAECSGFRSTDFVQFQAVKDSLKFFDNHRDDQLDIDLFDGGWVSVDDLEPGFGFTFNFLPDDNDSSAVDGHRYFFRVRSRDVHGNISQWSEVKSAKQDVFEPGDIQNLTAQNDLDSNGVVIKWQPATDTASEIKHYVIYRQFIEFDSKFDAIDTISGLDTTYVDSFNSIGTNKITAYKVGSSDVVGHALDDRKTSQSDILRAAIGPVIALEEGCDTIPIGSQIYVKCDTLSFCWNDYDDRDVEFYEIRISGVVNDTKFVNPPDKCLTVPLTSDGAYHFMVRAFQNLGRQATTWSNVLSVIRKTNPPLPVEDLFVTNAPDSVNKLTGSDFNPWEGNNYLIWTRPDTDAVAYEILRSIGDSTSFDSISTVSSLGDTLYYVDRFVQPDDSTLQTFQDYYYAVLSLDILNTESPDTSNIDSTHCNRAPVINSVNTNPDAAQLLINWSPPENSKYPNDLIHYFLFITQNGQPWDTIKVAVDTTEIVEVPCAKDYCVTVLAEEQNFKHRTAQSEAVCTFLHCNVHIPDMTTVEVVDQPLDYGIFVSWASYWQLDKWDDSSRSTGDKFPRSDVNHFQVERIKNGQSDTTFIFNNFPEVFEEAAFLDTFNLEPCAEYTYQVTPCETEGNDKCAADSISKSVLNDTSRVFIPEIDLAEYAKQRFFRGDSLLVNWFWPDPSCQQGASSEMRNADSVCVQISNNRDFVHNP
ncbi:MAG: hypothetical protein ACE5HS_05990, partial [bacterium]